MAEADALQPKRTQLGDVVDEMVERGIRRVHVVAWRDLDDPDAGGSEVHADEFMSRWAAAGLDVVHRTSTAVGYPATAVRNGYRVDRAGNRYTVFAKTVVDEMRNRLGESDAFVEIWNGVPWFSPLWYRKPRLTIVHHIHGPMWDQLFPAPFAAAGRALETRIAPRFYHRGMTVTPSGATRDELLGIGFHPDRVVAVNNGIDAKFVPGAAKTSHPSLVAVGRLAPVKRFDRLIEQAAVAKQRHRSLTLKIIGEGPARPALEQRIAELGAQNWVELAGRVDDDELIRSYQQAWLTVSASLAEGWGLSLTEGAACGTPAVATDISGHRSSVLDNESGLLVPIDNLGEHVAAVLANPRQLESLRAGAMRWASQLSWDTSALGIAQVLRDEAVGRPNWAPTMSQERPEDGFRL